MVLICVPVIDFKTLVSPDLGMVTLCIPTILGLLWSKNEIKGEKLDEI